LLVLDRGGVQRVGKVGVESDADDASLGGLVFGTIQSDHSGVGVEHVVSDDVRLCGTVASLTL
jgi:hypothetical protein